VKEFGLLEDDMEEEEEAMLTSRAVKTDSPPILSVSQTRSGRHVRPSKRLPKDQQLVKVQQQSEQLKAPEAHPACFASPPPPPFLEYTEHSVARRRGARKLEKYVCLVCKKTYLGNKKMDRHLKVR
jgi:hypothetical protein